MNLLFVCFSPILAPFAASVNRIRYGKDARKRIGGPAGPEGLPSRPQNAQERLSDTRPDAQSGAIKPNTYGAENTEPRAMRPGVRCVGYFMLL